MSLSEAMLEIAADMEEEATTAWGHSDVVADLVRADYQKFAKMIRRAVKAAGDSPAKASPQQSFSSWEAQQMAAARAEFRGKNKELADKGALLERFDGAVAEAIGGPLDATMVPFPTGKAAGELFYFEGVYAYRVGDDGKLHYDEDKTQTRISQKMDAGKESKSQIILP